MLAARRGWEHDVGACVVASTLVLAVSDRLRLAERGQRRHSALSTTNHDSLKKQRARRGKLCIDWQIADRDRGLQLR